jgi:hypothetical protein
MAVEFRCRRWFTDEKWRLKTHAALSSQGIAWVAADELEHETFQKDREQTGLTPGQKRTVLPVAVEVTTPDFFYVRVHRRSGKEERRLTGDEIAAWRSRIEKVIEAKLAGPIYVLWGTDHANIPLLNSRALHDALPEHLHFEWKPEPPAGTIAALFQKSKKTGSVELEKNGGGSECEAGKAEVEIEVIERIDKPEPKSTSLKAPAKDKGIKRFFNQL